jgi:hypothetical protein
MVRVERDSYNFDYPTHCYSCEGWGGVVYITDPAMTLTSEVGERTAEVTNCENCIQRGRCPRCMESYNTDPESSDYEEECSTCGFRLGETPGKPYPHICICEDSFPLGGYFTWRKKRHKK